MQHGSHILLNTTLVYFFTTDNSSDCRPCRALRSDLVNLTDPHSCWHRLETDPPRHSSKMEHGCPLPALLENTYYLSAFIISYHQTKVADINSLKSTNYPVRGFRAQIFLSAIWLGYDNTSRAFPLLASHKWHKVLQGRSCTFRVTSNNSRGPWVIHITNDCVMV